MTFQVISVVRRGGSAQPASLTSVAPQFAYAGEEPASSELGSPAKEPLQWEAEPVEALPLLPGEWPSYPARYW